MPRGQFSLPQAENRRLWKLLGEMAVDYWEHTADDSTPVLEWCDRRRPQALPARGRRASAVLRDAYRFLSRNALHLASPRYYGLMNPKPAAAAAVGDALASILNPQLAVEAHSPGATALERETLGWFLSALGWGRGLGQFTSGGSEANLVAMKLALNARLPEVSRRGVRGLRGQPVFYVSEECHHSVEKFADLLGLGREAARWIATDDEFAMRPEALREAIRRDKRAGRLPFCVVATFGTTSSGAIDPIAVGTPNYGSKTPTSRKNWTKREWNGEIAPDKRVMRVLYPISANLLSENLARPDFVIESKSPRRAAREFKTHFDSQHRH